MVEAYKPLYTVRQAAQILLMNVSAVYGLMNTGQLPYLNLGQKKIRGSDLERFIEKYPAAETKGNCDDGGQANAEKSIYGH
ncbi:hypothetical protein BRYFOR_07577 [Marvinbryantia formatexigens DSM 14469]|uniref:Helix-turn-helix domain-containing protein n=1 Tax=Marvinbryantia formatexigens DSM 14469 TaxID=478749 RepID=C6LG17_9FIRM|nr:helix-turn-helix domain-containing protein [Marvinbryantia formatexigens]EET60381.1 hypothetical protein BRYFOR_07577 [Marvinbryantia formatexigens DSM 14469]UWO25279.1 helix-turn-helix domain-containing protein [Marvinbryantia formatexigens DSM 14469]SDH03156.1 Helix-turn-helix domain-containing protein [Marvinbryantia formatexigens]